MGQEIYGGVDYAKIAKKLREELRKPWRYLPKEQSVTLRFTSGTPANAEGTVEVTPPAGYSFAIRYFKLTTPLEVQGNVLLRGMDGVETRMLTANQVENLADQLYCASDWDADFFFLKAFKLYGLTTAATTADRDAILRFSGGLVK